jgi:hypothetical protein
MARKAAAKPPPQPLIRPVSEAVKESFIECHSEGHTWRRQKGAVDPLQAEAGMRPPFNQRAVGRRAFCDSCGCERLRWYTASGEVVNRYRYADGYLHKKHGPDDDPAPTRLQWRRTLVATVFKDFDL